MSENNYELLSEKIKIYINDTHRFGTDAFLLSDFSKPRHKDLVCDLCTGSGIVALLMKKNFEPKNIIAVEIQEDANELLKKSIAMSELNGIEPICCDLTTEWEGMPKDSLDLVTCNPPYKISGTGAKNNTDSVSIARHEVMCSIDDVCKRAASMLKFGGRLCLCNRPERLCDVIEAMKKYKLEPKRVRFVSKTPKTAPWLFLIEGKKGANPFLSVEPQLYIQGENGFSEEMLKIYGKVVNK